MRARLVLHSRFGALVSCILLLLSLGTVHGLEWTEEAVLTPSEDPNPTSGDFGPSVSISGDFAIVGTDRTSDNGTHSGSAYVYQKTGLSWHQAAKLVASDASQGDFFGMSVSISGNAAIVGASGDDDHGLSSGSAYVFEKTGADWVQVAKLTASDGTERDYFGRSVSISGNTAIVGAYRATDVTGAAYVFQEGDTGWTQVAKLLPSTPGGFANFGWNVCIDGERAIVGAFNMDPGAAFVYERAGSNWREIAKLNAPVGDPESYFGYSVSISGSTVIVSDPLADDNGGTAGSAYIFRDTGSGWVLMSKLMASDAGAWDWFGHAVSISNDLAVVGARTDDECGTDSGSVYVFQNDNGAWLEAGKYAGSDTEPYDWFGGSLDISDNMVIVRAERKNLYAGSAYIFSTGPSPPPPPRGDANGDGKIDGVDLAYWQQNYDPLGVNENTYEMGDFNQDGKIDGGDLAIWQQSYDPIGPGGMGGTATIPEPLTLWLLGTGALVLIGAGRKRRTV